MRRLVYLAALAAAAPDTDTQLKRAAALARWVDRTGPAGQREARLPRDRWELDR